MAELGKQYDCGSCNAVCCRSGVTMQLSAAEVAFMERGGAQLTELRAPTERTARPVRFLPIFTQEVPATEGSYRLASDCGYLATDVATGQRICAAYDDPERPSVCGDFRAGGYGCRIMRVLGGVDVSSELQLYLEQTAGV